MEKNITKTPLASKFLLLIPYLAILGTVTLIAKSNIKDIIRFVGVNEVTNTVLYSFPVVKAFSLFSGILTLGFLILVVFFIGDNKKGLVNREQLGYLRWVKYLALIWTFFSIVCIPLDLAYSSQQSLSFALHPDNLRVLFNTIPNGKVWLVTAIFAILAAISAHYALSWGTSVLSLFWTVCGFLPLIATGHSAAGGNHDLATNSLLYHVGATAVWLGGLVALAFYVYARGTYMHIAIKRFSNLALISIILMIISGIINVLIRIDFPRLFDTHYGFLILIKIALTVILGIFGFIARKFTIKRIKSDNYRSFIQFVVAEIIIFSITFGVAIGLAETPPPIKASIEHISQTELVVGYTLPDPPSVKSYLLTWRIDLLFAPIAIILLVGYLYLVHLIKARGDQWKKSHTVNWTIGSVLLLFITSSGIGRYSLAVFSSHMIVHMFLSMIIPIFFVLGAPITLALKALSPAKNNSPLSFREWILLLLHSTYSKVITNPVVATVMFIASFYILYFSGLFESVADEHLAHILMNIHFLMSGYIFYWIIIGSDPYPKQLNYPTRFMLLCISIPFHSMFGVIIMHMRQLIADNYYHNLGLTWTIDRMADQKVAGMIAWVFGDPIMIVVVAALFFEWFGKDQRDAARLDRNADRNEEYELMQYNEMLKNLNHPQ